MQKKFYDYDTFVNDCKEIGNSLEHLNYDTIIAISRGGVTFGHFLASNLNIRQLYTINAISYESTTKLDFIKISNIPDLQTSSKVLICDDIIDSGDTMFEVLEILNQKYPSIEFDTVALFYKNSAKVSPTHTTKIADCWIEFFWEND